MPRQSDYLRTLAFIIIVLPTTEFQTFLQERFLHLGPLSKFQVISCKISYSAPLTWNGQKNTCHSSSGVIKKIVLFRMEGNCHINNSSQRMPAHPYNSLSVWIRIFQRKGKHFWEKGMMINKCVGTIGANEGCLEQIRHVATELSAYPSRFSPSISQGKPSPETQPDHSSPPQLSPTAFPRNSLRTFSLAATFLCKVHLSKSDLVPTVHL